RNALDWVGQDRDHGTLLIRLTVAGALLWNHFSLIEERHARVLRAIDELPAAGLQGTNLEMQLQVSLAGAVLFARGVLPEVMTAANRALEIASALGDTDYHLRCLRMVASFDFWNGRHDAALQALETFISISAERDPSALHVGETHHALGDI